MDNTFYLSRMQEAADKIDKKLLDERQLEVYVGTFGDCVVLKLYKRSWANPFQDPVSSPSRIFFSVWIDPNREGELSYNIHALKLRQLKGYKIESRKFAEVFRKGFKDFAHRWENVRVEYGPLTLMQGFVRIEPGRMQEQVLALANEFFAIEHLIDEVLADFRV